VTMPCIRERSEKTRKVGREGKIEIGKERKRRPGAAEGGAPSPFFGRGSSLAPSHAKKGKVFFFQRRKNSGH